MTADPESPTPRSLSLTEAAIPIASLIVLVALSFFLFGDAGTNPLISIAFAFAGIRMLKR